MPNFENIQKIDLQHKRITVNLDTGDFISGEYDIQLEEDFKKLCIYDNLIKLDIKDYYGKIYTHYIEFGDRNERFLSNLNLGATNGLLLGNYLSLYFAEIHLAKISESINFQFNQKRIDCEFTYFSDDFYFFCNKTDNEKVIEVFNSVLEEYNLERNENKKEIWTYEEYNNYNLVERYWKKVITFCLEKYRKESQQNSLYFINQLIYRMSMLMDDKLKTILINNFFKTKYFQSLDNSKFEIRSYDYHQLGFIFKFSPESLLYAISKLQSVKKFDRLEFLKFFQVRYKESLKKPFNEEQLFFYYAIKLLGLDDLLKNTQNEVIDTKNQVLISYYLQDKLFSQENLDLLKQLRDECYWFQNYHLILYTDLYENLQESINRYLIPRCANKAIQKQTYYTFYASNLSSRTSLIKKITDVNTEIQNYLKLKILESRKVYNERKK